MLKHPVHSKVYQGATKMTPKLQLFLVLFLSGLINTSLSSELSLRDSVDQQCNDDKCHCAVTAHNVHVHCTNQNLAFVPRGVPLETTYLDLSNNPLPRITRATFKTVDTPNLHTLDMSHCDIATIDENAFVNASFKDSLVKLYLSNDRLSDTQELMSLIKIFKRLQYIDIRNNTEVNCLEITNYAKSVQIICDEKVATESTTTTEQNTEFVQIKESSTPTTKSIPTRSAPVSSASDSDFSLK